MAVKTIVIGLGSFGHDVCDVLLRRIEAETGDISRIPWVRFMIYETEQQTKSFAAQKGRVKHMGIGRDTWERYLQTPGHFDPAIGFSSWANDEVREAMRDGGVPTHGANNSRPTGRLCFIDQANQASFEDDFRTIFNELSVLTEAEALHLMGIDEPDQRFHFAQVGQNNQDTIKVYVLGSLAGGTNSGAFNDVGYFIQTLQGIADQVETIGVVVIPNEAYVQEVHWGNVYAALTEINHFVGGKPYEAKYASRPNTTRSEAAPYNRIFILQSFAGGANTEVTLDPIKNSVAELIHLDAVSDPQEKVQNTIVNAFGQYGGERDIDGRPMNYGSLGASIILFPVDHILEGLSSRLSWRALERVLARKVPADAEVSGFMRSLMVDAQAYNDRMVKHPKVEAYLAELGQQTAAAANAALKGNPSERDNIRVRIENGIAKAEQGSTQNFQGEFRNPIYEVSRDLATERLAQLDRSIATFSRSPEQGLYWTLALLKGVKAKAEERLQGLISPDTDVDIHAEAASSQDRARAINAEIGQKKGCNPFAKKPSDEELSKQWVNTMNHYWRSNFLIKSGEFEKEILGQLLQRIGTLIERIQNPDFGLIQFAESVKTNLRDIDARIDKRGPIVNGLCLFVPGVTIGAEWLRYLPTPADEDKAERSVLNSRSDWFDELTKPRDLSQYDRSKRADWRDVEAIEKVALWPFALLREELVENRLHAWTNWRTELDRVAEIGGAFIQLDPTRNPFGIPGRPDNQRRPAVVYFHDPAASTGRAGEVVTQLRTHNVPSLWEDRHRILFTEGLCAFSLYSIKGVPAAEVRYTKRRQTRSDIAWQKLNGKPLDEQERYSIGLILASCALGIVTRKADGTIRFQTVASPLDPSREFELCKNRDLADASYRLGQDRVAGQDLRKQVERAIDGLGVPAVAEKISLYNVGVVEWQFVIGTIHVDNREAFIRELEFLHTIPGLIEAILDRFEGFDPKSGNWKEDPGGAKPASYRCSRCKQFLAPMAGTEIPSGLPEVCPNASCQQQIRFDKILGLTR